MHLLDLKVLVRCCLAVRRRWDSYVEPRRTVQGFAAVSIGPDVFAPQTLAMTGDGVFGGGYGTSDNFAAHQPTVAVLAGKKVTLRTAAQAMTARQSRQGFAPGARRDDCKLPRGAAADERRGALLVSCLASATARPSPA